MAPGSRLQELTAKYMQNPRRFFVPLANEYRKAHDLDRAIALCREHLSSQPGHMSGHIVLARAYYEKGDIAAAREVFLTSVELDDENLIALRHLGDIARSRNDVTEARQWYARVLDADPQNEEMERVLRGLNAPPLDPSASALPTLPTLMPFDAPAAPVGAETGPAATAPTNASVIDISALDRSAPDAAPVMAGFEVPAPVVLLPELAPHDPISYPGADLPTVALEPAIESALSDPTPPGLRAILSPDLTPVAPNPHVRGPGDTIDSLPDPRTPLDRFDLSSLASDPTTDVPADPTTDSVGIQVDDGVGFLFDDLDELVDPSVLPGNGASLPPVEQADFSAGIATPTHPSAATPATAPDELLSRPAFGALASFASWRTAQERETPPQVPAHPVPADADEDANGLFAPSVGSDSTPTAPEFVTETMAALYAQQGFVQQALDVYRALLRRSPDDVALYIRVTEMERALVAAPSQNGLEADADKALQFDDLQDDAHVRSGEQSMLEAMYSASPPDTDAELAGAFDSGWDAPPSGPEDDWFGDTPAPDLSADSGYAGDEIFGVSVDGFGPPSSGGVPAGRTAASATSGGTLEDVFGTPGVMAADTTAGDMLLALAAQMVGRLPKEAPTLPVPDILELPSSVPGDEGAGKSPAPLLSFDRFFSGSGSPPRVRADTPSARQEPLPWVTAAPTPVPSLSPTFGGLPVVPPPVSVPPAAWGGFDQFVPPPDAPPEPVSASLSVAPTPAPIVAPKPEAIEEMAHVPKPEAIPAPAAAPLPPPPERARTVMPAALSSPPAAPPAPAASEPGGAVADKPERSDFHRWLEGLS